ncbi:protein MTSS 1 isoform X2 [Micropterus salmoides]|uniref:protein MTSS 1 isoform X2 n=1 Tax=Micropterus salmoides TaxID=27706 RepID=UPI0018EB659B|nr:protein MTSS 1 isoform X2 [Micropterus salmoides]
MDAGIEKECSALGGLFQLVMNDMKASYPTWEDFVTKGAKLQSQLRTTLVVTGAFLDAFQKVADMATGTRGATKDIGSALTRMCMRHRSIESKLKLFTTALSESLITPLELKMEEWKKVASQLDKDHAKEYKKARADIKKKSSDTIKLQKKVKKGKGEARGQLDSALQDVNVRYAVLEETEKRAVCRALIEERARYCSFVSMLKPVLDHEINMLGEVTHLQTILEDLTNLTAEPNKLPPASEQVILDLNGSDFNYTYQTPPASPSNTMSRKSSISSNYQSGSVRHVPSLDSISCAVDGVHIQDGLGSTNQLAAEGCGAAENGMLAPPHNAYTHHGERARAMSASGKSCSARDQLALTLGALNSDAPRSSRDSLHCSSGYSTQTTTPSCSEDTIHTHMDYETISLHGDADSFSLHHLSHGNTQSDFDKSSTIPRNSDLGVQFRKFAQSKRPSSTVSLLAEPELTGRVVHQLPYQTATIRRKPSSKPAFRRGTISGGVPIPICTPQVPPKAIGGNGGSDENVFTAPSAVGAGGLGYSKLCTSTQSLSALPPPSSSPYYQLVPGQMPIPVPVPTVPSLPPERSNAKQFQQTPQQQQQINQQLNYQQQQGQLQQHNQQLQIQQQQQYHHLQQVQQQQQLQQQVHLQQQLQQQVQQVHQQLHPQFQEQHVQHQQQLHQQMQQQLQQQQLQQQVHQLQPQFQEQHVQLQHHVQEQQFQQQLQSPFQQQLQQQIQQQQSLLQQPQQLQHQQDQYQQQLNQKQKQILFQQQQAQLQPSASQVEPSGLGHSDHYQPQAPPPCIQDQNPEQLSQEGGGDMLHQIRKVKLKRTITNDRSAPLLPPPTNHKLG